MSISEFSKFLAKLEFTFKYQFTNEESKYGSSIQGIICILLSPLLIPIFMLIGYRLRLIESIINNKKAPKFESYDELFKEGVSGFFVYLPIFALIMFSLSVTAIGIPIFIGIAIVGLYIWPAASIVYSIKRNYKEVYGPDFVDLITSKLYMKTYIGSVFISMLLLILISFFGITTLGIGLILILPIYIYSKPILWGQMYTNHELKILK